VTQVIRWPAAPGGRVLELGPAIDEFLALDFADTTIVSYGRTLEALREDLGADVTVAGVERAEIRAHLESRYGHTAPTTYNQARNSRNWPEVQVTEGQPTSV
jgi:hypothetical protein